MAALNNEIRELRIDLAYKDNLLDEHEEMVAAKDQEIAAKASAMAEMEKTAVDVEELRKSLSQRPSPDPFFGPRA